MPVAVKKKPVKKVTKKAARKPAKKKQPKKNSESKSKPEKEYQVWYATYDAPPGSYVSQTVEIKSEDKPSTIPLSIPELNVERLKELYTPDPAKIDVNNLTDIMDVERAYQEAEEGKVFRMLVLAGVLTVVLVGLLIGGVYTVASIQDTINTAMKREHTLEN